MNGLAIHQPHTETKIPVGIIDQCGIVLFAERGCEMFHLTPCGFNLTKMNYLIQKQRHLLGKLEITSCLK